MARQFQRVTAICPIKRLGSLMDLSPFIDGAINRFGQRTVLGLSAQALSLYRNRLSEAKEEQNIEIFRLAEDYPKKTPAAFPERITDILKEGENLIMPVSDDRETSKQAGRAVRSMPNALITATDCFQEGLYSIEDFLGQEFPFDFVNAVVRTDGEDVPCPLFLNGHLKLLQAAFKTDSGNNMNIEESDRKPVIWTAGSDKAKAKDFFNDNGLSSENTIAFHLTANSHYAYRDMMSKKNFLAAARYFISRGFSVLLVTGSILTGNISKYDKSYRIHSDFLNALDSPACRLFYGDCLVEAEVIRLCRMLLSGETGVAHLASAVGTPKITVAATSYQTGHFLMTGPYDKEFFVRESTFLESKRLPKASEIIAAAEDILQKQ